MKKNVYYRMQASAPDPRNSGDTHSWFFFYKWRAGETWVPAKEGCLCGVADDVLCFEMHGLVIGMTRITMLARNQQGELELHFDSDNIMVPIEECPGGALFELFREKPDGPHVFRSLKMIPEGQEPEWLKLLLAWRPDKKEVTDELREDDA